MNGKSMLEIELGNMIGIKCKGGMVYHRSIWNYANWKYKKGHLLECWSERDCE